MSRNKGRDGREREKPLKCTNFEVVCGETDQEVSYLASLLVVQLHLRRDQLSTEQGMENLEAEGLRGFGGPPGVGLLQDQLTACA